MMNSRQIVKRIAVGSSLRTLHFMTAVVVSFFMMPFLVHTLGNEQYGLWAVVGSIVGFYSFLDIGLASAVGKFTSESLGREDYDKISRLVNTALVLFGSVGLFILVLSAGIAFQSLPSRGETVALLLLIMGINIGLQFPVRSFSGLLTGQLRFDLLVYVELFKLLSRTVFIVIFLSNGYQILTIAIIYLSCEILGNILELFIIRKTAPFVKINPWKYFDKGLIKTLVNYGWKAFIVNVSEMARWLIIPLLVTSFIGLVQVVIYGIALRLLGYFEQFVKNSTGFVMPLFSRLEGEGSSGKVKSSFRYLTIVSTSISVFIGFSLAIFGEPFIKLWMGEDYISSFSIAMIMLLPVVLATMQFPAKDLLFACSKHGILAVLNVVEIAGLLILAFLLPHDDTLSIAYAFALSIGLVELVKPYFTAKILETSPLLIYWLYFKVLVMSLSILSGFYLLIRSVEIASYMDIIVLGSLQTLWFTILGFFILLPNSIIKLLVSKLSLQLTMRFR